MSKKQSKKTTSKKTQAKANARTTGRQAAANKSAAAKRERATSATAAAPAIAQRPPAAGSESRLPPPGTVIQKRDRYGAVRCECAVEDAGIRYNGNLYRSLSGAAMAAAKDLGLHNKTQNGFTFWGLTKPRRPGDPLEALGHAWERYEKHLTNLVTNSPTTDSQPQLAAMLDQHASALHELRGQVSQ